MSDKAPLRTTLGQSLPASHPSDETLSLLRLRRSSVANMMRATGPSAAQLEELLEIGARVPDHRRVVPFRFLTFTGKARSDFGKVLGQVFQAQYDEATPDQIQFEEKRFERAGTVIAVVSAVKPDHKTPVLEQTLTAGAVCQNILIAANAMGFAGQWLTEWYAYDANVLAALGLGAQEQIAGFIYLGTATEDPKERPRVDAQSITTAWEKPASL